MRSAFDEDKREAAEPKFATENLENIGARERAELDELKRKYNIQSQQDASKKLNEIKSERKELRTKLD